MQEKIKIFNHKGQRLAAILHTPEKETDKIVIVSHSFKGDKEYQPIMRNFPVVAEKEGYAVIRFDCFGSGESDGEFEDSTTTTQIEDLEDVIAFVKDKGYNQICLIGLSQGTTLSIMAYTEEIKCMVLWSPVFNHKRIYEIYKEEMENNGFIIRKKNLTGEEVKVGKKMLEEFGRTDTADKLKTVQCPTLAIIGSEDEHITQEKAERYMELVPTTHKLEVIQNGDHDYLTKEIEDKVIDLSISWLKEHF